MHLSNKRISSSVCAVLLLSSVISMLSSCGIDREYRLRFWEKCRLAAELALRKRHYKYAHTMAQEAVHQAEGFGNQDFRLGVSLCDLADVAKAENKKKLSEASYKRAIKVFEEAETLAKSPMRTTDGNDDSPQDKNLIQGLVQENLANCLSHLADLYAIEERFQESVDCFNRAATTYQSMLGGNQWTVDDCPLGQEFVECLLGLAQSLIDMNNYDQAAQAYDRALKIAVASNCPEFLLREIRSNDLKILKKLGREEDAKKLIADIVWERSTQEGNIAINHQNFPSAESLFRQAWEAAQQSIFCERRTMKSLCNLILVLSKTGKIGEMESLCRVADRFMNTHNVQFDKDYDKILTVESEFYLIAGRNGDAEAALDRQLKTRIPRYGKDSIEVCESMVCLGRVERQTGRITQAQQIAESAYNTLKRKYWNNRSAFTAMLSTAFLITDLNQYKRAEEMQVHICELQMSHFEPDDTRIIPQKTSLFVFYHRFRQHDQSLKVIDDIVKTLEKGTHAQRAVAFPYLVLIQSFCVLASWWDGAEPVTVLGQSILHNELSGVAPDENSKYNWNKNTPLVEQHFGRKF